MGQKVHPYGFRLGFNRTWHSRWFSEKDYQKFLHDDLKLRGELKKRLSHAGVQRDRQSPIPARSECDRASREQQRHRSPTIPSPTRRSELASSRVHE